MKLRTALFLAALALPATSDAGCKELGAAIERSQKEMAMEYASGFLDNSAPRETLRQLRASNELASVSANLMLMDRAKCPLPGGPFDPKGSDYLSAALECQLAMTKNGAGSSEAKAACNRDSWKRNEKTEMPKADK